MEKNEEEPLIKKGNKASKKNILNFSSSEEDNYLKNNLNKLLIIIVIIIPIFIFNQKLIYLKHNYLSDNSLLPLNIFYSKPKINSILFIILICRFTVSSGFKLLILQCLSYIITLVIIISKNKIFKQENIFEKNLVVFHCSDIIITFLYLGEKLIQICENYSFHISILIIILFFNYNLILYFVLVEILNCKYDDIIIDILLAFLFIMILYYTIFYIMKLKIWPKKIISFLLRYIFKTFFICLFLLVFLFMIAFYYDYLEYFFANKIMMKIIGFLFYLIFELYFLFRDKSDKKYKYFNLYNLYSNEYLYSKTSKIKLFIRVIIILLLEYFLLYKLDIAYKLNMEINNSISIIILDILHFFTIMFIMKYIFYLICLNNAKLFEINDTNNFLSFDFYT
jgi:hypothetical protein